jgi:hypothetical protein
MDIEHCGLSWNLEVSIEQEKNKWIDIM